MDAVRETDNPQPMKTGPNPGLLRPPIVFLCAILLGIAIPSIWLSSYSYSDCRFG